MKLVNYFRSILMLWHNCHNKRTLPWKEEKDPYRIWVSEIILQQTRAEQGILYYHRFLSKFSSLKKLANASLDEVYLVWEGLGYYNRARNMHETAKTIMQIWNGKFPSDYESILSLKGIGPYTAAAISSFAFQLPYAVVDGNVFRVLSRFFGISTTIDSTEGKKLFSALAQDCLDTSQPHLYNQAIMDFGATVCKPEQPLCESCGFKSKCFAFIHHKTGELPVKSKKKTLKTRYLLFFIYCDKGKVAIEQRSGNDIWKNLYQFPLIEVNRVSSFEKPLNAEELKLIIKDKLISITKPVKQQLTHQLVYGKGIIINGKPDTGSKHKLEWVATNELRNRPFPRLIHQLMNQELINMVSGEKIY